MDIHIHVKKSHIYIIVSVLFILSLIVISNAQSAGVDTAKQWHTLHQVARSETDLTSVDENGDGFIDRATVADSISGLTSKCELKTFSGKAEKVNTKIEFGDMCGNQMCLTIIQAIKGDPTERDILNSGIVKAMKIGFFTQVDGDVDDNDLHSWSLFGNFISNGINGDNGETMMMKIAPEGTTHLKLLDDWKEGKFKEYDNDKWTYRDLSDKYGGRLFICQL